jgi:mRNA interferase MazF
MNNLSGFYLSFSTINISMEILIKKFIEWINLKEKLHNISAHVPLVKERDVWWVSIGENIGSEINGKSRLFSRPAVVLKKLARGLYLVAPTTSGFREGSWYVEILSGNKTSYICLHQVRVIDWRRLSSRMGSISSGDFKNLKQAFWNLYK